MQYLKLISFFALVKFSFCLEKSTNALNFNLLSNRESTIIERFKNWFETHRIKVRDDDHLYNIFQNWISNDKFIEETNSKNLTYTLGHNEYSGMNTEEFSEFMGFKINAEFIRETGYLRGYEPELINFNIYDKLTISSLPAFIDWRTKGVVSDVQNQASCGSCWAFSATSTLESATAIKSGKLTKLSEQQLVSCAGLKYGNLGCNGGNYFSAWNYVKDNGGQCSLNDYPYTSGTGTTGSCVKGCGSVSGTKLTNYVDVTPNSDVSLMEALTVGPVSIAIEADTRSFQLYNGGIYSDFTGCNKNAATKGDNSQPNIDHAVVLVGYGTDSKTNQDYWILRNSWGTTWGDIKGSTNGVSNAGYMLISKGSQYGPWGMCGVLYDPMYPVV